MTHDIYLECQTSLDFVGKRLCHDPVKVKENLHGKLRVDALRPDQIVKSVSQRYAETTSPVTRSG